MDFDLFKTVNWKTTACAGGYVICKIVGFFVPGIETACGILETIFVSGGFLSAADSSRVQNVVQAVDHLLGINKITPPVIVTPTPVEP